MYQSAELLHAVDARDSLIGAILTLQPDDLVASAVDRTQPTCRAFARVQNKSTHHA